MAESFDYPHIEKEITLPSKSSEQSVSGVAHDLMTAGAPPQTSAQQVEVPEGGTKAWLTLAGAACGLFVSFGWANSIGLFQAYYEEDLLSSYPSSTIAWITSMEVFFMLFCAPLTGRLFDAYGPTIPLAVGGFLHVFGLMMTSLSRKYYQILLSQSVCSGIGTSLILLPSMSAPQTFFRSKRGIAGGATVAGSSLGGVIFPLMIQRLIPEVGFSWTMRICAFMILALVLFALATIRSNLDHHPRPFLLQDYTRPLQEANFLIMAISSFFAYWGLFVPFNEIVVAAQHYGMSAELAIDLVPIMNGASFFGRIIPNLIADKLGRFNVMIATTFLSAILCLALWLPGRSDTTSIAFAALFGISSGAIVGLGPVLVVGISPMREVGTRIGMILAIAAVGVLTAPPIGAALAAATGTYTFTALFAGLSLLVGMGGLVGLRGRVGGYALGAKV